MVPAHGLSRCSHLLVLECQPKVTVVGGHTWQFGEATRWSLAPQELNAMQQHYHDTSDRRAVLKSVLLALVVLANCGVEKVAQICACIVVASR